MQKGIVPFGVPSPQRQGFACKPLFSFSAQIRNYAYTTQGQLLSEYQGGAWKRDVIYLENRPLAEIDAAGVHELHDDHLGTPRLITSGATGATEGYQTYFLD
jgi:uncharacterized protein RhaS with RHS repeats